MMIQRINAIFENGVFRPESPVSVADGERVLLQVETRHEHDKGVDDLGDVLDLQQTKPGHQHAVPGPSLEEVRNALSTFKGSLADRISEERDER